MHSTACCLVLSWGLLPAAPRTVLWGQRGSGVTGLGGDSPRRHLRDSPSGSACSAGGWKPVLGREPQPSPAQVGRVAPLGAPGMASRGRSGEQGNRARAVSWAPNGEEGLGEVSSSTVPFPSGKLEPPLPHFLLLCVHQPCRIFLASGDD